MGKIFGVDRLDWRFIPINWDAIEGNEILAGTPMDKDGNIANNANCFGVLMDDLLRGRNKEGRVVISGCIDLKAAEAHSGMALSAGAKAALPNLWSAGGASSWNDLTDKPFGTEIGTAEITWDGDTTGLTPAVEAYYKVSDKWLDYNSLIGHEAILTQADGGSTVIEITSDNLTEVNGSVQILVDGQPYVISASPSAELEESEGFEVGTYFAGAPGVMWISKVTYTGEVITTLDPKYIVLTSPNGTKYNLSVSDSGALSATEAT